MVEVRLREGKVDESRRPTVEAKMVRVEEMVARMMTQLDPTGSRNSTDKTPYRVARMYLTELCSGYYVDIEELFEAVFPNEGSEGMVVVHHIPLYSMCEHHWLLITGHAHVGYLPNGQVLGLSKVARVVDAYARRMQLQERMTRQIADAIDKHLDPHGVMVVIEAEHHCLSIRGVQKPGTITTTSEIRGLFEEGHYQDQFFRLVSR
jgi:GTP cyclohydrolase I